MPQHTCDSNDGPHRLNSNYDDNGTPSTIDVYRCSQCGASTDTMITPK
jgi:hypothetical protein